MQSETIVALATAPGRGGVAVLRLSGPQSAEALCSLTGDAVPPPRKAVRARFHDPRTQALLDDGLVLWFAAPASFTGEDVVEIHCHGGRAVVDSLLDALTAFPGVRPAEAGEFTRRAFDNGKMDLTQAEALADLVNAETQAQQRQALRQMDGGLTRLYEGWRADLIKAYAHLEAYIDFPDEDIPDAVMAGVQRGIQTLAADIGTHLNDGHRGERLRDGVHIAVLGPPNAGKSSLVNAIARREAAIVSATAGTTRDVVEVHLDLGGWPVVLADTAGLRDAAEEIEAEGIRRALIRAEAADLKLVVIDGASWPAVDTHTLALVDASALIVVNKSDLAKDLTTAEVAGHAALVVSARTGQGMAGLLAAVEETVAERFSGSGGPALTRQRHRTALEDCRAGLLRALQTGELELMAEDMRLAARALGRITGRVDVDDLLDVIFRDFCIGK